jgi:hypothetical protein
MRCGNDVVADDFAEAFGCFDTGANRYLDGGDITAKTHGNQTIADLLKTEQVDITGFGGHISGFYGPYEATGLY